MPQGTHPGQYAQEHLVNNRAHSPVQVVGGSQISYVLTVPNNNAAPDQQSNVLHRRGTILGTD